MTKKIIAKTHSETGRGNGDNALTFDAQRYEKIYQEKKEKFLSIINLETNKSEAEILQLADDLGDISLLYLSIHDPAMSQNDFIGGVIDYYDQAGFITPKQRAGVLSFARNFLSKLLWATRLHHDTEDLSGKQGEV